MLLGDTSYGLLFTKNSVMFDRLSLKNSNGDEISYEIPVRPASSFLSALLHAPSSSDLDDSPSTFPRTEGKIPRASTTNPRVRTFTTEQVGPSMMKPAIRSASIKIASIKESTFSSTVPKQTVPSNPSTSRSMLTPIVTASAPSSPTDNRNSNLFIVNDEMGRQIYPVPIEPPKGLFEVRDEMGRIIPTATTPSPSLAANDINKFATMRDNNSTLANIPRPNSGLSKFKFTREMFSVSGGSNLGLSPEILQLSGRSKRRYVNFESNGGGSSGENSSEHGSINLIEVSLSGGGSLPEADGSAPACPVSDHLTNGTATTPTHHNLDSLVADDEVGRSTSPSPRVGRQSSSIVSDEMATTVNQPESSLSTTKVDETSQSDAKSATSTPAVTTNRPIPKSGNSRLVTTKAVFKMGGEFGIGVAQEILNL